MNMKVKKLLLAILISMAASMSFAYDAKINGIYYIFSGENATVTFAYYDSFKKVPVSDYKGNIVIPSTVTYGGDTYNVTKIGVGAFYHCDDLKSVQIPSSVVSIQEDAFYSCYDLEKINFASIADMCKIEYGNFDAYPANDSNTKSHVYAAGKELKDRLIIPKGIKKIKEYSLMNLSLTYLEIPDGLWYVGAYAFCGARAYHSTIFIGNGRNDYLKIGYRAFAGSGSNVDSHGLVSKILCYSKNPPEYYKPKDAGGYDTFCFNKNNFENGNTPTVYVLPGCKSRYNNTSNPFWNCNFVEMSDAMVGIESVDNDENLIGKVYNLNGQRQRKMQKGINIIRFLDGTTKKVLVK